MEKDFDWEDPSIDERRAQADEVEDDEDLPEGYEPGICPACSGSGEGQHESSRCYVCKGKGEV